VKKKRASSIELIQKKAMKKVRGHPEGVQVPQLRWRGKRGETSVKNLARGGGGFPPSRRGYCDLELVI